jgi:hypothetical protein
MLDFENEIGYKLILEGGIGESGGGIGLGWEELA